MWPYEQAGDDGSMRSIFEVWIRNTVRVINKQGTKLVLDDYRSSGPASHVYVYVSIHESTRRFALKHIK